MDYIIFLCVLVKTNFKFFQETSPPLIPPLHKYGEGFTLHFVSRRRRDVEGKGFTLKGIQGER
jgi:hypothetical protein